MASNKSKEKKDYLSKKTRQNRKVPLFVVARTAKKVSRNSKSRQWRSEKLKLKIK